MTNAAVDAGKSRGQTGLVNGEALVARPGGGDAESNMPSAPARPNLAELVGPRRSG